MERCGWKGLLSDPLYIEYHDSEWGVASHDDSYLFEMLLLESFHCGLSWLLILRKRENFRRAFDGFDPNIIATYDQAKVASLLDDSSIVRSRAKIEATISNAKAFLEIQKQMGSFSQYIWSFTLGEVLVGDSANGETTNWLSDKVSKDLKKRGFKFMGSVTTYSFLEAIGVMNNHAHYCFRANK